jgi:hypothetical protein
MNQSCQRSNSRMKTHFQSSGSIMAAFAARVMMVNESIVSLGGASSKSVS